MKATPYLVIAVLALVDAAPYGKIKYDQRQEGKWNIRADLENFVVLILPKSPSIPSSLTGSEGAANTSLLDFLSKTIPLASYRPKKHKLQNPTSTTNENEEKDDTEEFIESKTAPYHVDISRSRSQLAKLHPGLLLPTGVKEDVIKSPSVALLKTGLKPEDGRAARAVLIAVPKERMEGTLGELEHGLQKVIDDFKENGYTWKLDLSKESTKTPETKSTDDDKPEKLTDKVKDLADRIRGQGIFENKVEKLVKEASKKESEGNLVLLGAQNEQCGPEQRRNRDGVCVSKEKS